MVERGFPDDELVVGKIVQDYNKAKSQQQGNKPKVDPFLIERQLYTASKGSQTVAQQNRRNNSNKTLGTQKQRGRKGK